MDRFNAKIKTGNGCWEWLGGSTRGYGMFNSDRPTRKYLRAHRLSYEIAYGKIPQGNHVLHKCDNSICVRPDHLFLGTQADNMRDMAMKERSGRQKLSRESAYAILWRAVSGETCEDLAIEYGVSPSTGRRIVRRETWPCLSEIYD
jgi:hypothetical protein